MGGMAEGVEEPREVPMLGDLIVGLDPPGPVQRGITTDLAEASVIGGVAQHRGQDRDAPEDRDGEVVAAAAPRSAEALQDRGVRDGLEASTQDRQRRGVFECGPGEQRLSGTDPHGRESPLHPPVVATGIVHRDRNPRQGGRGVKIVILRTLRRKVAEKPGWKCWIWGKSFSGSPGGVGELRTYDIAPGSPP